MRKIISLLSVTGLLLALSAVPAKATCYTIPAVVPYNGYVIGGELCLGQNNLTFTGTATANGKTYDVVAFGAITGSGAQSTLSGSITVSLNGQVVKQVTIQKNVSSGQYDAVIAFLEKLLAQLPKA